MDLFFFVHFHSLLEVRFDLRFSVTIIVINIIVIVTVIIIFVNIIIIIDIVTVSLSMKRPRLVVAVLFTVRSPCTRVGWNIPNLIKDDECFDDDNISEKKRKNFF